MQDKNKLAIEPYKGVRDFYPKDLFIQNYIFGVMRNTVEGFGYTEYATSLLEPAELYEAKTGEEIVSEQTYTFTDRGDRRVTLRPEMTPSVARLVAGKKHELAFPLRWYSIPNVFRYERPQRGRLREHWQLNCDIFGVENIEAEAEMISLISAIMSAFGAKKDSFQIKINNRESIQKELGKHNLTKEQERNIYKVLDKKEKIDDFDKQLRTITDTPIDLNVPIDAKTQSVVDSLNKRGITNVVFDPTLVRGFDYYNEIVFEVFDTSSENNRSLFGGGRYDNLLDIFKADKVPAVGFGMGDVTIRDFLETHDLLPSYVPSTDLYITTLESRFIPHAQELAAKLRSEGINVAVNLLDKKIGDQIKTADKLSIPFILAIGEEELKSEKYKVKNLETGEECTVTAEDVTSIIWGEEIEE